MTLYDTQTGEIAPVQSHVEGDYTVVACDMYAEDSVLYRLEDIENGCQDMDCHTVPVYQTVQKLTQVEVYHRQEKNVVLLDYARYRVDDGDIQEKEEILRLDNKIREQLGFLQRKDRMNQLYHMKKKEAHTVTLYYDLGSEIDTPAFLAIEEPDACQIWLNGENVQKEVTGYYVDPAISMIALPKIKAGHNELVVQVEYNQKTNLENLFILGDFAVELRGNQPRIVREEGGLSIGDITSQGMPFYTGNLEYTFRFDIEDEEAEYYVHIPHFKAPLLGVSVDGSRKGLMAYVPHRQKLGKLTKGSHELTICLYGNRFNGFGTLHNANDDFLWYGPDSFRTTGDDWTDSYRIRTVGIFSAVEIQKI